MYKTRFRSQAKSYLIFDIIAIGKSSQSTRSLEIYKPES